MSFIKVEYEGNPDTHWFEQDFESLLQDFGEFRLRAANALACIDSIKESEMPRIFDKFQKFVDANKKPQQIVVALEQHCKKLLEQLNKEKDKTTIQSEQTKQQLLNEQKDKKFKQVLKDANVFNKEKALNIIEDRLFDIFENFLSIELFLLIEAMWPTLDNESSEKLYDIILDKQASSQSQLEYIKNLHHVFNKKNELLHIGGDKDNNEEDNEDEEEEEEDNEDEEDVESDKEEDEEDEEDNESDEDEEDNESDEDEEDVESDKEEDEESDEDEEDNESDEDEEDEESDSTEEDQVEDIFEYLEPQQYVIYIQEEPRQNIKEAVDEKIIMPYLLGAFINQKLDPKLCKMLATPHSRRKLFRKIAL